MEISDIRVKLIQDAADRLKAVCSITLDDEFVVRDLKIVEGTNGLFVAMPSRKLSVHCPQCRGKNHLRARFCNECGAKLPAPRVPTDPAGRIRLHRDIAHPINPEFREIVQSRVIEKYKAEIELAQEPGYAPLDIDHELDEVVEVPNSIHEPSEYDQLIAGLKNGSDASRDPELRTPQDVPGERRGSRSESEGRPARPPRPQRGSPARPAPQRRGRDERPVAPPRGRAPVPALRPAPMMFDPDDAPEEQVPSVEARPAAKVEPPPMSRPAPPPASRRAETPPPRPPQPVDEPEDPPFGAGIL